MNLIRWDPFRELEGIHGRLNRFFNELPARRMDEEDGVFLADWAPSVDIQETDKEFLVKVDLPEVKKEEVKVEMQDNVLSIEGERKREKEEKGKQFHRVERAYGKFVRRFSLPTEVDAAKVVAEFNDGVLQVHMPKLVVEKPKPIAVKVA